MRRILLAALAVLPASTATACGSDGSGTTLTVFAAASLTDAFDAMVDEFEMTTPGVEVRTSYAGSSSLREQLVSGAPADVFASADTEDMDVLLDAGIVVGPTPFATNRMAIVVPAGNPGGVRGTTDFADDALLLGLCASEVPCGRFADEVLARAGVDPVPDTREPDVRALLTKVAAGELDAGIVYATDVVAAGDDVEGIEVPAAADVTASYPIAVTADSAHATEAQAFVDFVTGPEGREILASSGFGAP